LKPDILLVEPMMAETEASLGAAYTVHRLYRKQEAAELDKAVQRIRAVVTGGGSGLPRAWLDRLPALGLVAINGVGTDKVDLAAARERGIHVTTTPGVLTDDVADMAMGLILAVLRRIPAGDRLVRDGSWAGGEKLPLGSSLRSRRLGILGLGQIGHALGLRAQAFGMSVSFFNRSHVEAAGWERCTSPAALAQQSDVLAICLAATPDTAGIVNAEVLEQLGPEGILVNVARGSVVDEPALIAALREGRIAGAGLDVFLNEPQIDPAFMDLPNVVLTPHQGSATLEARQKMARIVLDSLAEFFAGETPHAALGR
jgi:lactate dehydrogenase-like 2-hydroxyacid dehydrogenase